MININILLMVVQVVFRKQGINIAYASESVARLLIKFCKKNKSHQKLVAFNEKGF